MEKQRQILKDQPLDGYFLQDYSTDPHHCQAYAKLLKENTVLIERMQEKAREEMAFSSTFSAGSDQSAGK